MPVDTPTAAHAAGLSWRLRRRGRAGATRLLLLHGTGSSGRSWEACAPGLEADFDMLIPDLPGHGGTEPFADRQASLPRMAQALGELLESLAWPPTLAAGHSAGAALMVQLALDGGLPQARGLLAVNGALQPLPGVLGAVAPAVARWAAGRRWLPAWVSRHAAEPRAFQRLMASTGSHLDEAGLAHYRALLAQPGHVQGVLDMLAGWRVDQLQHRLHELQLPLWLVAGLADRTVAPVQSLELARRLKGARFVPLARLGHLAHEEAPAAIAAVLQELRVGTAPPET